MRAGFLAVFLAVAVSGAAAEALPRFAEAPEYRNGEGCPASMASVYSLLKHASCPESIFFHFLAAEAGAAEPEPELLQRAVAALFPSLRFEIYPLRVEAMVGLISASVRAALVAPLNYARNHLADLLQRCVPRAIYLDSDALAAAAVFAGRRRPPCYFSTGVMVIDLRRWHAGNYRKCTERWMGIQKEKRIYKLGSLPPFLIGEGPACGTGPGFPWREVGEGAGHTSRWAPRAL